MQIKREEFPSKSPRYPDTIIVEDFTNADFMKIIESDFRSNELEINLIDILRKRMTNYNIGDIYLCDRLFMFLMVRTSLSLGREMLFKVECSEGHVNDNLLVDIIKDVNINFVDYENKESLMESITTVNGETLTLEALKIDTIKKFRDDITSSPDFQLLQTIDETILTTAAYIKLVDGHPVPAIEIYQKVMGTPLINNRPDFKPLTQQDIFVIKEFKDEVLSYGPMYIEKPCSHADCGGSVIMNPLQLYVGFIYGTPKSVATRKKIHIRNSGANQSNV